MRIELEENRQTKNSQKNESLNNDFDDQIIHKSQLKKVIPKSFIENDVKEIIKCFRERTENDRQKTLEIGELKTIQFDDEVKIKKECFQSIQEVK